MKPARHRLHWSELTPEMRWSLLAPFALAIEPVLFLYQANVIQVVVSDIGRALLVCLGTALVLMALFWLLLGNPTRGAVLTAWVLMAFFTYGHVFEFLDDRFTTNLPLGWHQILLPIWAVLLTVGILIAVRSRQPWHISNFMGIVATIMMVMSLIGIISYSARNRWGRNLAEYPLLQTEIDTNTPPNQPDIYYIILDSYSREDILREFYGYDNSGFLQYLRDKGFYVADQSEANYPFTFLSLTTSLNMQYASVLTETEGAGSEDQSVPYYLVDDSQVRRAVEAMGYRYIHVTSGWGPTLTNSFADENIRYPSFSAFEGTLAETTLLSPVVPLLVDRKLRGLVPAMWVAMERVPQDDAPTFVFAHMLVPHFPYPFTRVNAPPYEDPSPVDGEIVDQAQYEAGEPPFVEQTVYVNRSVKDLVDHLLADSATPPIIVIQADHGNWTPEAHAGEWGAAEFKAHISPIFNAYYVPEELRDQLYPSITPVNTWRLIFGVPLLEDRIYYSDRHNTPFDFIDVTELVDSPSP